MPTTMPRSGHYRKVIRVRAEDSPNVRLALAERAAGLTPSGRTVLPGVLSWREYLKRRATWDKARQCVGLDGAFYEGAEELLFPPDWLAAAGRAAIEVHIVSLAARRRALAIGVDPAEGGDLTAFCAGDALGVIELVALKTPDTNVIPGMVLAFAARHQCAAGDIVFDRGGGVQHADRLRAQGHAVLTIGFGDAPVPDPQVEAIGGRYGARIAAEGRGSYKNRRAQMYHEARALVDPGRTDTRGKPVAAYGIPSEYAELHRQLGLIPLTRDEEGRGSLLPKSRKPGQKDGRTLTDLIGRSPDEADAFALMVHRLLHRGAVVRAG